MNHAPAPWTADPEGQFVYVIEDKNGIPIGEVYHDDGDAEIPGWEANTALMTSAPELLEALKEMLEAWQTQFGEDACDCMPEPQNRGHVCQCCKAKYAIEAATNGKSKTTK